MAIQPTVIIEDNKLSVHGLTDIEGRKRIYGIVKKYFLSHIDEEVSVYDIGFVLTKLEILEDFGVYDQKGHPIIPNTQTKKNAWQNHRKERQRFIGPQGIINTAVNFLAQMKELRYEETFQICSIENPNMERKGLRKNEFKIIKHIRDATHQMMDTENKRTSIRIKAHAKHLENMVEANTSYQELSQRDRLELEFKQRSLAHTDRQILALQNVNHEEFISLGRKSQKQMKAEITDKRLNGKDGS